MKPMFSKIAFTAMVMTNLSAFAQTINIAKDTNQWNPAQLLQTPKGATKAPSLKELAAEANKDRAMGGVATGGGDSCESRIKEIGLDINLWIKNGGYLNLKLPSGVTYSKYAESMSGKIASAKIACVSTGDKYYPIEVGGTPKVCKFYRQVGADLITCDATKFKALTEDEQYALVHHEYAGLADLEKPNGDISDYSISNQISAFLETQKVKKLAIKPILSALESYAKDAANIPVGSSLEFGMDFITKANLDKTFLGGEQIRSNCQRSGEMQICDVQQINCSLVYGVSPSALKIKQGTKFYLTEIQNGWKETGRYRGVYVRMYSLNRQREGKTTELALLCESINKGYDTKSLNNILKKSINSEIALEEPQDF